MLILVYMVFLMNPWPGKSSIFLNEKSLAKNARANDSTPFFIFLFFFVLVFFVFVFFSIFFQEIFESFSSTSGMDGMAKQNMLHWMESVFGGFLVHWEKGGSFAGKSLEWVEGRLLIFDTQSSSRVFIDFIFGILFNDNSSHLN